MNISGAWQGEYTFDENEEAKQMAGHIVNFTMTLRQGFLGFLIGTIQDDARTGFPEQGQIKGRTKGDRLDFRKLMPSLRLLHDGNRLTLEKWAERRKVVMDANKAHPPIRHVGTLSADGRTAEGTWHVAATIVEVPGSYESLKLPEISGTWKMKRTD